MYNRFIPEEVSFTQVEETAPISPPSSDIGPGEQTRRSGFRLPEFFGGKGELFSSGREGGGLSGLLKGLHLEHFDSGDLLLLLILLYLLKEGDDLDLVIALGVVLLMGICEEGK